MYRVSTGHKLILVVTYEVKDYLVTIPNIEELFMKLEKHL